MMLEVLEPTPPREAAERKERELAARLDSLEGRTVAFVDGWGGEDGNTVRMYPLIADLMRRLRAECGVAQTLWYPKESISRPLSEARLAEVLAGADAVVVGEAI